MWPKTGRSPSDILITHTELYRLRYCFLASAAAETQGRLSGRNVPNTGRVLIPGRRREVASIRTEENLSEAEPGFDASDQCRRGQLPQAHLAGPIGRDEAISVSIKAYSVRMRLDSEMFRVIS